MANKMYSDEEEKRNNSTIISFLYVTGAVVCLPFILLVLLVVFVWRMFD